MTDYVKRILRRAKIKFDEKEEWSTGGHQYYLSKGNQIFATYKALSNQSFRKPSDGRKWDYAGWEGHHVIETQDLKRLEWLHKMPPREEQLCVLLPPGAHRKRINAYLHAALGDHQDFQYMKWVYSDAYIIVGNYCGARSESQIHGELMGIVTAIFEDIRR